MTSQQTSTANSGTQPDGDGWVRGSYTMRGSDSSSDGVNGTIVTGAEMREEAGVAPGEEAELYVVNSGSAVRTVRSFHNTGNTVTIPLEVRQKLSLSEGDEIEFWVRDHDDDDTQAELQDPDVHSRPASDEDDVLYLLTNLDPMKYHLVLSQSPEVTMCGKSLGGAEFRVSEEEPGEILDRCLNCVLESDRPMRKDELVQWLADEVGFDNTTGSSGNLNKEQMRETVEHIRSLRGGDR
ncbi:AbrB/MazE/SpoVT family DNA-binding domain-containing protein [Halobaculum sp. MBLA0143]|uniref:AbrB/MazE/SpoVT family DNA-binding domain-containing protein n=1 Tax=Halobaculum sp. MBLA0143 TaxID=3079933 RepID=UPI00352392D8